MESTLQLLVNWLEKNIGLNSQSIGIDTIYQHIIKRASWHQKDIVAYYALFLSSPVEQQQLINDVTIPETWFFRDTKAFIGLTEYITRLVKAKTTPINILSLPCATGEEPYSIAICLDKLNIPQNYHIDAIDISELSLEKAKQAQYNKNSFRNIDSEMIRHYFSQHKTTYQLHKKIRDRVHFMHRNILHTPLYKHYHIIFCRNLLIYMTQRLQTDIINKLTQQLFTDGQLFLGYAETILIKHPLLKRTKQRQHNAFYKSQPAQKTLKFSPLELPKIMPLVKVNPAKKQVAEKLSLETIEALANAGNITKAFSQCQEYIIHHQDAPAFFLAGIIAEALQQQNHAEAYYKKTIYLDPHHEQALMHLSLLAISNHNPIQAQRYKERAQRLQKYT